MGLGSIRSISLKEARLISSDCRRQVTLGLDPIEERKSKNQDKLRNRHLLTDIAKDAFEAKKAELKDNGSAGRWFSPLELHVLPKLGKLSIASVNQVHIKDTLEPIWHSKAATARKAAERLNIVFKHAAALGLDVDIQAVSKAKALLGRQRHIAKPIPSLPWQMLPQYYATLSEPTVTHLALRLLIHTGLRSKPIRFAHLDEIKNDIWTVPARNMKGRVGVTKDFRVPLSEEALRIIDLASQNARGGYLFPSTVRGVLSDATMSRNMERSGYSARPHGFRTSLRTWLAECTDAPHEVAEMMIAHESDSKVVRAYRRTDYIEQRTLLHKMWSEFVLSCPEG